MSTSSPVPAAAPGGARPPDGQRPPGYVSKTQSTWAGAVPGLLFGPIELLGGITQLAVKVAFSAIARPVGYWGAVRDEMYTVLKATWFPIVGAMATFGFMGGIQCFLALKAVGAPNRCGQYFYMVYFREFSPWINSLVVAGVIGAAITSDLGARKIREELDALDVLGVDPVRELVLPRIVSITLLTPMFMIVSITVTTIVNLLSSVKMGGVPVAEYMTLVYSNLTVKETMAGLLKAVIIGFVVGVICSYKGLNAAGGAIGVGRAVNQAVVLAFVATFIVGGLFNMILLGLNPDIQILR